MGSSGQCASSTNSTRVPQPASARNGSGSKDSNTRRGSSGTQPAAARSDCTVATMSMPSAAYALACLSSATRRTCRFAGSSSKRSRSENRRIGSSSLNCELPGRYSGRGSRARSVASSAQLKSSVNHPDTRSSSPNPIRRRLANSGRSAMSVDAERSCSCRTTSTPSALNTRSGSTASAPWVIASRYADSVCSGRRPLAPRWPMIRVLTRPG